MLLKYIHLLIISIFYEHLLCVWFVLVMETRHNPILLLEPKLQLGIWKTFFKRLWNIFGDPKQQLNETATSLPWRATSYGSECYDLNIQPKRRHSDIDSRPMRVSINISKIQFSLLSVYISTHIYTYIYIFPKIKWDNNLVTLIP